MSTNNPAPRPAGATSEPRRGRWEQAVEMPLTAIAFVFLVGYAIPILDPTIGSELRLGCLIATWVAWACFLLDYVVRLVLSVQRGRFVRENVIDLLVVALPLLRPLRLLRLVTLLNVLNRTVHRSLQGRVAIYVGGAMVMIIFISALAIVDAERTAPGASITEFGDGLWWSLATLTTVGYGDYVPITTTGKFIAAGLMFSGLALIGIVTASLATWFIASVRQVEEESEAATRRDVKALAREVASLREELAGYRPGSDRPTSDNAG
jgi:voltage-gated potassium channel